MIRVGVIGFGYWGPNLVRNFQENPETELVAISDTCVERLSAAKRRYPAVRVAADYREMLAQVHPRAILESTRASKRIEYFAW